QAGLRGPSLRTWLFRTSPRRLYAHPPPGQAALALAPVRGQLAVQAVRRLVEGGFDRLPRSLRAERLPGGVARHLDPVPAVHPRAALRDDLDLVPDDRWARPPFELRQTTLGFPAEVVGDAHAAALEDQIHDSPSPLFRRSTVLLRPLYPGRRPPLHLRPSCLAP